jgi:hypothetical protein
MDYSCSLIYYMCGHCARTFLRAEAAVKPAARTRTLCACQSVAFWESTNKCTWGEG